MIRALVMTHGGIGKELVSVAEMILGPQVGLEFLSNHGKSATAITAAVAAWLEQEDGGAVILIDDYGGSCANAARLACGERGDTAVLSGVNLAMVLGFLTWRESGDFLDLVRRIVEKGREAIVHLGGH